jgi:acyl-CoA synthetase (AMP-forming)/AMP-acid ligase II
MTQLIDQVRFNRIFFRDQVFTKEYLAPAVDECARYLDKHIRSNSPIVYLVAPNHIKTIVAFLGIAKTGRATMLVDPKTGKLEYEEMLADTTPSAIMKIDPATIDFDYEKEIAITDYTMDPKLVAELDDVCVMLYTAAEDGYAKAAMLTQGNMLSNAHAIIEENRVDIESVTCALLPIHHLFGFQNGVISPLVAGGSIVIYDVSDTQSIHRIAENINELSVTHLYSVPLIYYLLSKASPIKSIGKQAYSLIVGGYKLPASVRSRYEQKLEIPLYEGYGLTEASPVCTWQCKGKRYDNNSVGLPMVNYKVRIIDAAGNNVPSGETGEICVSGDNIMKGYFNHPVATRQTIISGWLHTGDYGKQDKNGNVFLLGLKKKMFNVGGNKVYPEEVKRLMMKNSNVKCVEFSSDYIEILGDKIHADISLKDTSIIAKESFFAWCKENLTPFKIPEEIAFF